MKKTTLKKMATLTVLGLTAFGLVACGNSKKSADGLTKVKDAGKLTVATASGYAPYEFIDMKTDPKKIIGVDMAFSQKLADKLGVKLDVKDMQFSSILGSVTGGKVDMAIAGMTQTEERSKSVDFSDPYVVNENVTVVRAGDQDKWTKQSDFESLKMVVQKATTQETVVKDFHKPKQMVSLDTVPEMMMNLKENKVDATVIEASVAKSIIAKDSSFAIANYELPKKYRYVNTAIAVEKGNKTLLAEINKMVKECKDNGDFAKWFEKYDKIAAESGN